MDLYLELMLMMELMSMEHWMKERLMELQFVGQQLKERMKEHKSMEPWTQET